MWMRSNATVCGVLLARKVIKTITVDAGLAGPELKKLLLDRSHGSLALAQKSGRIIYRFRQGWNLQLRR